jgi:hypothetical protein
VNLNVRNFPDDLHARLAERADETGYDLRDLVIEAVENLLGLGNIVTCPLCGMDGPLVRFGSNARCAHCNSGFMIPEGA